MIDLYAELIPITQALEKADIGYALVGGLAYSAWVEVRATEDIDLLIEASDWEKVIKILEPLGYLDMAQPMDFPAIKIRRLTKIEKDDLLILDFLLAESPELILGIRNAVGTKLFGSSIRVAKPEVIIQLKQSRMSAQDKTDIEGLSQL
jgi:hypothetical protein